MSISDVYPYKVNSRPICQFPSFSTFGVTGPYLRKPQDILLGKHSFYSRSHSDRYCQSVLCSEHTFEKTVPLSSAEEKIEVRKKYPSHCLKFALFAYSERMERIESLFQSL